ncbi:hypothetical protein D3C79_875270 [compost metagenome]
MLGLAAARENHRLAGTGGGTAHAVDLLAIWVGAADDAQQQCVAGSARDLGALRQVVEAKKHAFAGAATDVGGRNSDLRYVSHGNLVL